jgi:protein-tyrosine sulfotransferase
MFKKLKAVVKSNSRMQPLLHRIKYAARVLINNGCLSKNLEKSEGFLFVVGCGRSGNTLLRRLLMEKFDIYIPPETYVLPRQVNQYGFSAHLQWPEKVDAILSMLENHPEFETFGVESVSEFKVAAKKWPVDRQSFLDLIEGLYKWLGEKNNFASNWLGDKTPLNTLSLGLLHRAFPKAKFIFLERDPVDVVQSYLEAGLYQNADDAADRWLRSLKSWQSFRKLKSEKDLLELRYEDLVANPTAELEKIGNQFFIPERKDEKKIETTTLGDVGSRQHHSNVQNPPSTTSIGKGRTSISAVNLRSVRKVLGSLPQCRGYQKI